MHRFLPLPRRASPWRGRRLGRRWSGGGAGAGTRSPGSSCCCPKGRCPLAALPRQQQPLMWKKEKKKKNKVEEESTKNSVSASPHLLPELLTEVRQCWLVLEEARAPLSVRIRKRSPAREEASRLRSTAAVERRSLTLKKMSHFFFRRCSPFFAFLYALSLASALPPSSLLST